MKLRLVVCVFFLLSVSLLAQENQTLKAVQAKFVNTNSFKVTFKLVESGKDAYTGNLYYQKENKTKVELKDLTIATDGVTTWNLDRKRKKVMLSKYKASDVSLISLPSLILKTPASCTVSESKDANFKKLILMPEKASVGFKKAEFWVNSENLIAKFKLTDNQNGELTFLLSDYQVNISLGDTFFTYKPIAGIRTIDLR